MAGQNSRLGTVTNLEQDGTYDILSLSFPKGYPNGAISLSWGNNPRRTTGVQKVAQAFVYCLFTTKGSDPIKPDFGTGFTEYLAFSNIAGASGEVTAEIIDAVEDAERQIKLLFGSNRNDRASQLRSAEVLHVDAREDAITLHVRIITKAGERAAVAIPFPQTNLELN